MKWYVITRDKNLKSVPNKYAEKLKLTFWHYCCLERREGGTETKGGPVYARKSSCPLLRTSRPNDASKKTIGRFNKQNNNFIRTCITLFCTFLYRFCTTTSWKCLISHFMENVNRQRRNFISLSELGYPPRFPWNSTSGGFTYIWQSKYVTISTIKTERTQIHSLSDIPVAVASLDLKVPMQMKKK